MNPREGIAIFELFVYIPTLITVIIVLFRQGIHKQLGWIYLFIFCVVRLASSVFEILHSKTPSNDTDTEWALILQSVGLSPLLLASLGLLKRVIDFTSTRVRDHNSAGNQIWAGFATRGGIIGKLASKASAESRRSRLIQLLQLPTTIALILCIVGGTSQFSTDSSPSDLKSGKDKTKAGIIIFVIIYIMFAILTFVSMFEVHKTARGEKRLLIAVIIALPMLGARLLYSVLCAFKADKIFNLVDGNVGVWVCMAVLEEVVIVVMYAVMGLTVGRYEDSMSEKVEKLGGQQRRERRNQEANVQWGEVNGFGNGGVSMSPMRQARMEGGGYR